MFFFCFAILNILLLYIPHSCPGCIVEVAIHNLVPEENIVARKEIELHTWVFCACYIAEELKHIAIYARREFSLYFPYMKDREM